MSPGVVTPAGGGGGGTSSHNGAFLASSSSTSVSINVLSMNDDSSSSSSVGLFTSSHVPPAYHPAAGGGAAGASGVNVFNQPRLGIDRPAVDTVASVAALVNTGLYEQSEWRKSIKAFTPHPLWGREILPLHAARLPYSLGSSTSCSLSCSFLNRTRTSCSRLKWFPTGQRLLAGTYPGELAVWNGTYFGFEDLKRLPQGGGAVTAIEWASTGEKLFVGDYSGLVVILSHALNPLENEPLKGLTHAVSSLSTSPYGGHFLAGCCDGTDPLIWDVNRLSISRVLRAASLDTSSSSCLHWHPHMSLIATGAKYSWLYLWDPRDSSPVATLQPHRGAINKVVFHPYGSLLLTCSRDTLIRSIDLRKLEPLHLFRIPRDPSANIDATHPLSDSSSSSSSFLVNSPASSSCSSSSCAAPSPEPVQMALNPAHPHSFVVGDDAGHLTFFSLLQPSKPISQIREAHGGITPQAPNDRIGEGGVVSLDWHPAGHLLATASDNRLLRLWSRGVPGGISGSSLNGVKLVEIDHTGAFPMSSVRVQDREVLCLSSYLAATTTPDCRRTTLPLQDPPSPSRREEDEEKRQGGEEEEEAEKRKKIKKGEEKEEEMTEVKRKKKNKRVRRREEEEEEEKEWGGWLDFGCRRLPYITQKKLLYLAQTKRKEEQEEEELKKKKKKINAAVKEEGEENYYHKPYRRKREIAPDFVSCVLETKNKTASTNEKLSSSLSSSLPTWLGGACEPADEGGPPPVIPSEAPSCTHLPLLLPHAEEQPSLIQTACIQPRDESSASHHPHRHHPTHDEANHSKSDTSKTSSLGLPSSSSWIDPQLAERSLPRGEGLDVPYVREEGEALQQAQERMRGGKEEEEQGETRLQKEEVAAASSLSSSSVVVGPMIGVDDPTQQSLLHRAETLSSLSLHPLDQASSLLLSSSSSVSLSQPSAREAPHKDQTPSSLEEREGQEEEERGRGSTLDGQVGLLISQQSMTSDSSLPLKNIGNVEEELESSFKESSLSSLGSTGPSSSSLLPLDPPALRIREESTSFNTLVEAPLSPAFEAEGRRNPPSSSSLPAVYSPCSSPSPVGEKLESSSSCCQAPRSQSHESHSPPHLPVSSVSSSSASSAPVQLRNERDLHLSLLSCGDQETCSSSSSGFSCHLHQEGRIGPLSASHAFSSTPPQTQQRPVAQLLFTSRQAEKEQKEEEQGEEEKTQRNISLEVERGEEVSSSHKPFPGGRESGEAFLSSSSLPALANLFGQPRQEEQERQDGKDFHLPSSSLRSSFSSFSGPSESPAVGLSTDGSISVCFVSSSSSSCSNYPLTTPGELPQGVDLSIEDRGVSPSMLRRPPSGSPSLFQDSLQNDEKEKTETFPSFPQDLMPCDACPPCQQQQQSIDAPPSSTILSSSSSSSFSSLASRSSPLSSSVSPVPSSVVSFQPLSTSYPQGHSLHAGRGRSNQHGQKEEKELVGSRGEDAGRREEEEQGWNCQEEIQEKKKEEAEREEENENTVLVEAQLSQLFQLNRGGGEERREG
ncbi:wd g-beta repeat-containing protein [Cystoisospora suis]|uniref:Wd g-beta repeat-containing protein n=1 Tax=Cystoisospora suis TaxID=483139 RepID=A0A2C6KVH1_9APIC|nr:wd g-beta repeat-containing protein [Cystoisospora suis]